MAGSDKVDHSGHRNRMRAKYLKGGFELLADHEILEILLYYCIPRKNTNELAYTLLNKYKTLANVFDATPDELMEIDGISEVSATLLTMIPELSKVYENSKKK